MDIFKIHEMKNGWFVGDFKPTAFNTKDFEASYKKYSRGEPAEIHYHKKAIEINLLVRGKITIQDKELNSGDIFVLHPYEIANVVFLEDSEILAIKAPSVIGDKFVINN